MLIEGKEEVKSALSIRADAMHFVHDEVVKRMNEGKWFEQIYHEMVEIQPDEFKNHKYMRPSYGCYRFAIHSVYRLYHGWYNSGNPTDLFPAKSSDIAKEYLKVADERKYLEHANHLHNKGKTQLALHLIDVVIKGSTLENQTLLEAYNLKSQILAHNVKKEPAFIAQNSYLNGIAEIKEKIKQLNDK